MSLEISYYGRPVIKPPVWKPEVAWYLFTGGMAGASAPLALSAELAGNRELARRAWLVALLGVTVSPVLLIKDLGRPERFMNMLRVFKVTSPMSVGSWVLSTCGPAFAAAAARSWLGRLPRLGAAGAVTGALAGPILSTYTGVLLADTAVPVWHEARNHLPWLFAASSAASAGAAATLITPAANAGPARRAAVTGALAAIGLSRRMERDIGELISEPYRRGRAGRLAKAALALLVAGAATLLGSRGRAAAARAGSVLVLGGVAAERWAVFQAGRQSAEDPKYTVAPQRERQSRAAEKATPRPAEPNATHAA